MGDKITDFKMQRVASRGRKSKAGGEKIERDSIIFTPVFLIDGFFQCHRCRWSPQQTPALSDSCGHRLVHLICYALISVIDCKRKYKFKELNDCSIFL